MDTQIFSEFGLVGGAFIILLVLVLYIVKKAIDTIPGAITKHFEAIAVMQNKFSDNLDRITDKNTKIADGFIGQLSSITHEHEIQNAKLDSIHSDIKLISRK